MKLGNRIKSMIAYLKEKFTITVDLAEEGFIENFSKRFYKEKIVDLHFNMKFTGGVLLATIIPNTSLLFHYLSTKHSSF